MKKRILALALGVLMLSAMLTIGASAGGKPVINVWSFTVEIPDAIDRFVEMNPDFPYEIKRTVIPTDGGGYQTALNQALSAGGSEMPHMYMLEAAFVLNYTQFDMASFALPIEELGITQAKIDAAQIAPYVYQTGTRPSDNAVVALAWQNTGSCLIYRADLAEQVWGTSDPAEVEKKVGPGWDNFLKAAAELDAAGISIVSGIGDVWQVARNTAKDSYIDSEGYLYLDPARENFLDIAKDLYDGNFTNLNGAWEDGWFADMSGNGSRPVFCFLGPAWLINYVLAGNSGDTFGDWRVTNPPVGFSWGGTWAAVNKDIPDDVKAGIAEIYEWLTVDTSSNGFLNHWANGSLYAGSELFPDEAAAFAAGEFTKDAVSSGVVMANANGEVAILGGQDMFEYFIPASAMARADFFSPYDEDINQLFMDQVNLYIEGQITRDEAIKNWASNVTDQFGIPNRYGDSSSVSVGLIVVIVLAVVAVIVIIVVVSKKKK